VLEVGPCTVVQVKTVERDKVAAAQLGFEPRQLKVKGDQPREAKPGQPKVESPTVALHGKKISGKWVSRKLPKCPFKHVNRPLWGHLYNAVELAFRQLKDIRLEKNDVITVGQVIKVEELFKPGQKVDVIGTSKGKGFQGVMCRHNFSGVGEATHGQSDRLRAPGSVGGSSYPARVFKGQRMAGHMGDVRITSQNLKIVQIIPERNLMLVKGSTVGAINSYVVVRAVPTR
jgi:large subunit ribosomal protein L3